MGTQVGNGSVPPKPGDAKVANPKPTKALPTNRIAFQKQIEILRAFGALSQPDGKAVTLGEVSSAVGMHVNTISLINAFFVDTQLLQRTQDGLVPSPEVVEFTRAHEWNKETAAQRLAPAISRSWFAQTLVPKLRFRPMSQEEAVRFLADASTAPPSYKGQLETLLDYMQVSGLVATEGGQVRLIQQGASPPNVHADDQQQDLATPEPKDAQRQPAVVPTFASPAAGVVQFQVSVKVDMKEFAGWDPQRITAFFAGIAQVLAAKGAIEEQSSSV